MPRMRRPPRGWRRAPRSLPGGARPGRGHVHPLGRGRDGLMNIDLRVPTGPGAGRRRSCFRSGPVAGNAQRAGHLPGVAGGPTGRGRLHRLSGELGDHVEQLLGRRPHRLRRTARERPGDAGDRRLPRRTSPQRAVSIDCSRPLPGTHGDGVARIHLLPPRGDFTQVGVTVLEAQFCEGKRRAIGRWETLRINVPALTKR